MSDTAQSGHNDSRVKTQKRSLETQARILDAAANEFASHGFEGASLRAIAEAAGTRHQLIGYHFGSKADLWHAVVEHHGEAYNRLAKTVVGADWSDPFETFRAHLVAVFLHTLKHPQVVKMRVHDGLSSHLRTGDDALVAAPSPDDGLAAIRAAQQHGMAAHRRPEEIWLAVHESHVGRHVFPVQYRLMEGDAYLSEAKVIASVDRLIAHLRRDTTQAVGD